MRRRQKKVPLSFLQKEFLPRLPQKLSQFRQTKRQRTPLKPWNCHQKKSRQIVLRRQKNPERSKLPLRKGKRRKVALEGTTEPDAMTMLCRGSGLVWRHEGEDEHV